MSKSEMNRTNLSKKCGMRLKEKRKEKGLTQKKLAEAIGVCDDKYISCFETGKRMISEAVALDAASVLGVSADYLLGNTDNPITSEYKFLKELDNLNPETLLMMLISKLNLGSIEFKCEKNAPYRPDDSMNPIQQSLNDIEFTAKIQDVERISLSDSVALIEDRKEAVKICSIYFQDRKIPFAFFRSVIFELLDMIKSKIENMNHYYEASLRLYPYDYSTRELLLIESENRQIQNNPFFEALTKDALNLPALERTAVSRGEKTPPVLDNFQEITNDYEGYDEDMIEEWEESLELVNHFNSPKDTA